MFICSKCGFKYYKSQGKCNSCGEWNSIIEQQIDKKPQKLLSKHPLLINNIVDDQYSYIITADEEFNRLLGHGIVKGAFILIGGEPGIGKSTLALQIALQLKNIKILYISGEETESQIHSRAKRLKQTNDLCYIISTHSLDEAIQYIDETSPELVIIDSVQTLSTDNNDSLPGSISQVREITNELMMYSKQHSVSIIMIGHVNKDGMLAGPKTLEHMVDVVLSFEGDEKHNYRILRSTKNRFGKTPELCIYEMHDNGLSNVKNPTSFLLDQQCTDASGVAIGVVSESNKVLLIEVQVLVSTSYGIPQRVCNGINLKRLSILIAILEKKVGLRLSNKDVFVNIVGGLTVTDTSLDLAICMAILSSYLDKVIPHNECFIAEIGLCGELRNVAHINQMIDAAINYGFSKIVTSNDPKVNQKCEKYNDVLKLMRLYK